MKYWTVELLRLNRLRITVVVEILTDHNDLNNHRLTTVKIDFPKCDRLGIFGRVRDVGKTNSYYAWSVGIKIGGTNGGPDSGILLQESV